jgi:hypothetical protein
LRDAVREEDEGCRPGEEYSAAGWGGQNLSQSFQAQVA